MLSCGSVRAASVATARSSMFARSSPSASARALLARGVLPLFSTSARSFSSSNARLIQQVEVNGIKYNVPAPGTPLVALLIDGGSQEYLTAASRAGVTPFLDSLLARGPGLGQGTPSPGIHALVSGQVPTLTNPNNVAIVCGASAKVTGICGNYFLDETSEPPVERLMNSSEYLRVPTIFAKMQKEAGLEVTIVRNKQHRIGR